MLRKRLISFVLILFVIASCTFVGLRSIHSVHVAKSSNTELAQVQLPLFEKTQNLRSVLAMQNLSFHNYYLSNADETFNNQFTEYNTQVLALIDSMREEFGDNPALMTITK